MATRYLVVSDLHICDLEEHDDGWKSYKSGRFSIDADFAALLSQVTASHEASGPGELVLILNGDIFDFDLVSAVPADAPFPVSAFERKRGLLPTAEKSAWKLRRILHDHPVFVRALADWLQRGHRIVYVLGNHDRELHFTEVRAVLADALAGAAGPGGSRWPHDALRFEPWFYYAPGEIYAEHGQQYDHYSSFKHVLSPVVQTRSGPMIALPMGDLANRYLVTLMGFFNPHASDFILNIFRYLAHWLRYYAFTGRSLVYNWLAGSVLVMIQLLATKKRVHERPGNYDACLAQVARRARIPVTTVAALGELQPPPITTRFFRIAREFWVDRLVLALLMTAGTIALAVAPLPLWVQLMVPLSSFPLLFFVYERLVQGDTIFTVEKELPAIARRISQLLDVRVVTFGHTHKPRVVPVAGGVSFVDTGTWAPMTSKLETAGTIPGYRNFLLASFSGGEVDLRLDAWEPRLPQRAPLHLVRLAS